MTIDVCLRLNVVTTDAIVIVVIHLVRIFRTCLNFILRQIRLILFLAGSYIVHSGHYKKKKSSSKFPELFQQTSANLHNGDIVLSSKILC